MTVTLWIRGSEADSQQAMAFLRQAGYRPDRVVDLDKTTPTAREIQAAIDLVGPTIRTGTAAAPTTSQAAAPPETLRCPVLLTPKGGLAGFRERKWRAFLDMDHDRS